MVHARGRGEHQCALDASVALPGSSPRARGTRPRAGLSRSLMRFIPAGAGNTATPAPGPPMWAVQSPRARGTRAIIPSREVADRFIPAGAGNTPPETASSSASAVHPRGRGEHYGDPKGVGGDVGSSPRARGTRHPVCSGRGRHRFIPAGAGNMRATGKKSVGVTVHPRGRGEHSVLSAGNHGSVGSSPRARGTRENLAVHGGVFRFIPAGAGNT